MDKEPQINGLFIYPTLVLWFKETLDFQINLIKPIVLHDLYIFNL